MKLHPIVLMLMVFWIVTAPFFFSTMFYSKGLKAGRASIADLCWTMRGFAVDKENTRYFFDCNKTRETPISPWEK